MKNKTVSFLMIALFYSGMGLKAQFFDGGIAAGVSTGTVKMSDMNTALINTAKGNSITGFEGGLFSRFHFTPFYLKPMALINYQSGDVNFYNKDGTTTKTNFNDGKLEVPVLLGFHFLGILNVEAGPLYNWVFMTNTSENNIKVQPSGVGYRIAANVELSRLLLGLCYQGLMNKSSGSSTTTFQVPNELIFQIALNLGKKK